MKENNEIAEVIKQTQQEAVEKYKKEHGCHFQKDIQSNERRNIMGYMRKDEVMGTLQEDRETTLACYNDGATRAVVKFCYDSIERELERLPQYIPESMVEQKKICDIGTIIDKMEEEKEYANADFESYVQENAPHLDSEYDDTFCQGMERAIQILTGFFEETIQIKRNEDEREVQEVE